MTDGGAGPFIVEASVGSIHGEEVIRISIAAARILLAVLGLPIAVQTTLAQASKTTLSYEEKKRQANDIAVAIVVSGLSCTCARFAEDIRNVVNDLRP